MQAYPVNSSKGQQAVVHIPSATVELQCCRIDAMDAEAQTEQSAQQAAGTQCDTICFSTASAQATQPHVDRGVDAVVVRLQDFGCQCTGRTEHKVAQTEVLTRDMGIQVLKLTGPDFVWEQSRSVLHGRKL